MADEKIAIIGGAGFVGSSLVKQLKASNITFSIFDKNIVEPEINFLDVTKPETLTSLQGFSQIINLAAEHRDDVKPKSKYYDVNVQGAQNVVDIAKKYSISKIIFTSSVAVYGFAPNDTNEDGEINYFNEYGRTKYLAEKIYREWQLEDPQARTLVILRPTVIFGEGNRGNVYNLLSQIHRKKFIMLGNGENKKSMAYIENVSSCILYYSKISSGFHLCNYIDKPDLSMNQLVSFTRSVLFKKDNVGIRLPSSAGLVAGYLMDFIAIIMRRNFNISSVRVKKFIGITQFSSSKLSETSFAPPYSLKEGLSRTLTYEFLEDNSKQKTFDTE